MGFLTIALIIIVLWLMSEVSSLKGAVTRVEERLAGAREQFNELTARLHRVETQWKAGVPPVEATPAAPSAAAGPDAAVFKDRVTISGQQATLLKEEAARCSG